MEAKKILKDLSKNMQKFGSSSNSHFVFKFIFAQIFYLIAVGCSKISYNIKSSKPSQL